LMTSPVWKNIRTFLLDSGIDLLTDIDIADTARQYKELSNVIPLDTSGIAKQVSLIRELRYNMYDCVIDLFSNPRSSFLTLMTGSSIRIGFDVRVRRLAYNRLIRDEYRQRHEVEHHLSSLKLLDIPITDDRLYFPIPDDISITLPVKGDFYTVAPMGRWHNKRLPNECYSMLIDNITSRYNIPALILWGNNEENLWAEEIGSKSRAAAFISPRLSFTQMGYAIKRSSFLICNDTAALHLSEALNTPVIAFFGPTNPNAQGPRYTKHLIVQNPNLHCLGCNKTSCKREECLNSLPWEALLPEIMGFIEGLNTT